ncbi:MAG: nuclear transport factor 2 family protein [Eubacteriales bacterium]|nr:nuclear transport factor 2 family protein [Eubacteriales bacterium]
MKYDQLIRAYWRDVAGQNAAALLTYFKTDTQIRWHNTNEQFTVKEFIRANCEYPGEWRGEVERTEQSDDKVITVARVWTADGSASFHVTSFFEFRHGKIAALDEYWGDDGPAPEWRREKRIGKPIGSRIRSPE